MRLLIDVGNSESTLGLAEGTVLRGHWRLTTAQDRTPDEWAIALETFVVRAGHAPAEIASACIASVVPAVTQAITDAIHGALTPHVGLVDARAELPLTLDVDEPLAVGADRIANALAVLDRHPGDAIVVDLGTATTFDCVTADRRFIGGAIMPGMRTSAEQLVRRAAKLTATELVAPSRAIGRRTDEHIRAGVLFGTADAIDGMVRRMRDEWPGASVPVVVGTGGLATTIAPLTSSITIVDPDLTLHGLRLAADAMELPR
jgi:type III pantothenate kinase